MEEQVLIKETDVRQSEKIGKLALALSKAQNEFNKAIADNDNPFYKSKYADLSTIINSSREALFTNELALMQFVSGDATTVRVTTKLIHSSGEWIESTIAGKPAKQDCQQQGSVITYLRRYAQASILNIAQEDDDGNSQAKAYKDIINKNQAKANKDVIDENQVKCIKNMLDYLNDGSEKSLLNLFKIENITEIQKNNYERIVKSLNKRIEFKKEEQNKE